MTHQTTREYWEQTLDAPAVPGGGCPHIAQLYECSSFLADAAGRFALAALRRGETALLICTPEHRALIERRLAAGGVDLAQAMEREKLVVTDAAALLSRFMHGDVPDAALFEEHAGRLLSKAGAGGRGLRAYGDMVSLLWRTRQPEAALKVENLWDALATRFCTAVLCGYPVQALAEGHPMLDSVSIAHTHVLPSEEFLDLDGVDRQLAAVARLQQVSRLLSRELALKHQREEALREANEQLAREVEERRRAEEQLRAREAFAQSLVHDSRDCIKVLDLDGRLLFMNKGGMEQLELCDFAPLAGAHWLGFWHGEDRAAATAALEAAKRGGVGEFVGFFPLTVSRRERWWHVVLSPLRDSEGEITRILAVSRDVTERRRLELELRQALADRDELLAALPARRKRSA